ncbi:hypothetical protein NEFER03_1050 [Nematocida sp. LUAm3]|nr:hypothetical protein NEFER03_1050 [Nematocida sp. LUAm3]KAI5175345.1 hypothetical protein NEFER02_1274 [Nematocida sp. LUAm2]KAI5177698.1 hypothetical protein NEFER01_0922 [Nematocida sp. LUAm1]
MNSEYEKEKEKEKHRTDPDKNTLDELDVAMSEAEQTKILEMDPSDIARELTSLEIKTITEISPVEILKFQPDEKAEKTSPTLFAYLNYTESLSSYIANTIKNPQSKKKTNEEDEGEAKKGEKPTNTSNPSLSFWLNVARSLKDFNNANTLYAVIQGIKKTRAPKVLLEELVQIQQEIEALVSCEKEESLQRRKILYLRKIKSIEKHLIDASTNKHSKDAGKKFHRIIDYLNYIRGFSSSGINKDVNHAIIACIRQAQAERGDGEEKGPTQFEGCFMFLEHSNFLPSLEQ